MAAETINRLNYNEKGSQMDLSKTLIEYIKCGCNTSLTAKNLNLHRQSLIYRLEKIESLTGMSLNSKKDLFLLEIFTRILFEY